MNMDCQREPRPGSQPENLRLSSEMLAGFAQRVWMLVASRIDSAIAATCRVGSIIFVEKLSHTREGLYFNHI
jgi:hypothetical protein